MEADFTRFYSVDLRTVCWGSPSGGSRWPLRKILTHIRALPADSALTRESLEAPLGWDTQTELTAQTVDLLHALLRLTHNVNSEHPIRDDLPHVPRPFHKELEPEAPTATLADLGDFLKS